VLQGSRLAQKAHLWRLNGLGHPSSQAFDLAENLLSHPIPSSEEYAQNDAQNDQPSPTGNRLQRRRSRRQDHPGRACIESDDVANYCFPQTWPAGRGPADAPQQLTVIEKIAPSETRMRSIILVNFVPFTGSRD
jgi:hypothetical protein